MNLIILLFQTKEFYHFLNVDFQNHMKYMMKQNKRNHNILLLMYGVVHMKLKI